MESLVFITPTRLPVVLRIKFSRANATTIASLGLRKRIAESLRLASRRKVHLRYLFVKKLVKLMSRLIVGGWTLKLVFMSLISYRNSKAKGIQLTERSIYLWEKEQESKSNA